MYLLTSVDQKRNITVPPTLTEMVRWDIGARFQSLKKLQLLEWFQFLQNCTVY